MCEVQQEAWASVPLFDLVPQLVNQSFLFPCFILNHFVSFAHEQRDAEELGANVGLGKFGMRFADEFYVLLKVIKTCPPHPFLRLIEIIE